jgi:hypothetical protein
VRSKKVTIPKRICEKKKKNLEVKEEGMICKVLLILSGDNQIIENHLAYDLSLRSSDPKPKKNNNT